MAFVVVGGAGVASAMRTAGRLRTCTPPKRVARLAVRVNVQLTEPKTDVKEETEKEGRAEGKGALEESTQSKLESTWEYVWPRALLLMMSLLCGTNFGVVKILDESMRSSASATIRFTLAALALSPAMFRAPRGALLEGFKLGGFLFGGYIAQAIALQSTESNKIAFLNALAVVFVPIIARLFPSKHSSEKQSASFLAIILAVSGVGLLELSSGVKPALGDLFGLLQAMSFSCAYFGNERASEKFPGQALALSAAQLATVATGSAIWYAIESANLYGSVDLHGITVATSDPLYLGALAYTGFFTTALAVGCENLALQRVSASELAVIFTTQPFFASAFAAYWLNESLTTQGLCGGGLIILACLASQFTDQITSLRRRTLGMLFGRKKA